MNANPAPYTVLITGASSGIGYELALRYLEQGGRVFALARSRERLEQLTKLFPERCLAVKVDLSDAEDSRRAGEWINQQVRHLDLAILNAGTCEYVDINQLSLEPFEKVMAINWQGTINSLLFCLPLLRKKKFAVATSPISGYIEHGQYFADAAFASLRSFQSCSGIFIQLIASRFGR